MDAIRTRSNEQLNETFQHNGIYVINFCFQGSILHVVYSVFIEHTAMSSMFALMVNARLISSYNMYIVKGSRTEGLSKMSY